MIKKVIKNKKLLILVFLIILIIWLMPDYSSFSKNLNRYENVSVCSNKNLNIHSSLFFDEQLFSIGIADIDDNEEKNSNIKGGVVPHHLLANHLITDFFNKLPKDTENIILIGPNHYETGDYNVISSRYNWETPFGILESNFCLVDELVDNKLVGISENAIVNDHSINGIMPYIKYYLPEVKVVPLMLKAMTLEELDILSNKLSKLVSNDKTILVASVDFSHYLREHEAIIEDEKTKEAINNYDYNKIHNFTDNNLDSPSSIITLLKTMEKIGVKKQEIVENTNSGTLLNDDSVESTSYFEILLLKQ